MPPAGPLRLPPPNGRVFGPTGVNWKQKRCRKKDTSGMAGGKDVRLRGTQRKTPHDGRRLTGDSRSMGTSGLVEPVIPGTRARPDFNSLLTMRRTRTGGDERHERWAFVARMCRLQRRLERRPGPTSQTGGAEIKRSRVRRHILVSRGQGLAASTSCRPRFTHARRRVR